MSRSYSSALIMIVLGTLLFPITCCRHASGAASTVNTITEDLLKLKEGDLSGWKGLTPGYTAADLSTVFTNKTKSTTRPLVTYKISGCPEATAEARLRNDSVIVIRISSPCIEGTASSLLEKLGTPDSVYLCPPEHKYAGSSQWIYARLGITVYAYTSTQKELLADKLPCIAVYPPTSVTHYLNNLGAYEAGTTYPEWKKPE